MDVSVASSPASEDAAVLTAELISLGREAAKLKAELRTAQESQKKAEKLLGETKKALDSKEQALEKLRVEKEQLWAMLDQEKVQSMRDL